jgi:1,4-dihydroxy-6-naphthoate synthase
VLVCRPEKRKLLAAKNWAGLRIATPGPETTALLLLRLAHPEFVSVDTRFDKVPAAVRSGRVDAGLVIHESQITFANQGLVKVLDLGRWWRTRTGLPIPLGVDGGVRANDVNALEEAGADEVVVGAGRYLKEFVLK